MSKQRKVCKDGHLSNQGVILENRLPPNIDPKHRALSDEVVHRLGWSSEEIERIRLMDVARGQHIAVYNDDMEGED